MECALAQGLHSKTDTNRMVDSRSQSGPGGVGAVCQDKADSDKPLFPGPTAINFSSSILTELNSDGNYLLRIHKVFD
jgi:hypothetical protein